MVRLTPQARRHLDWWLSKLADPASWSGSKLVFAVHQKPVVILKSDASGSGRWGYVYDGRLHYSQAPARFCGGDMISYLEFLAVIHAGTEYGHEWAGSLVRHGLDNSSCVYLGCRPRSNNDLLQHLCEQHVAVCARHSYRCTFAHVSRRFNLLADLLTRFVRWQEFNELLPAGMQVGGPDGASPVACRTPSPTGNETVYVVRLQG